MPRRDSQCPFTGFVSFLAIAHFASLSIFPCRLSCKCNAGRYLSSCCKKIWRNYSSVSCFTGVSNAVLGGDRICMNRNPACFVKEEENWWGASGADS